MWLKTPNHEITFAEIPDEITLCINISGCPNHCKGCHSKFLWEDTGDELTGEYLESLITNNEGITCICFMGGDQDIEALQYLWAVAKYINPNLKVAWYSGREFLTSDIHINNLDYLKLGPYIEEKGPLSKPTTNQKLYRITSKGLEDITYKFWRNENTSHSTSDI